MRTAALIAIAAAVGGCSFPIAGRSGAPTPRADLADVGSAAGRQCHPSAQPGRLPAVDSVVDAAAVLAELGAAPRGRTVLSVMFADDGSPSRNQVVVAGAGYETSLEVRDAVTRNLLPRSPGRAWGVRVLVTTGDAPAVQLARQEICPAQALDSRVRDSYIVGVGSSLPELGIDPVTVNRYERAGYRQIRVRTFVDAYGRVRDISYSGSDRALGTGSGRSGPLGWLYDVTFEPTLVDGIATASWVDVWLLVPDRGLGLAYDSYLYGYGSGYGYGYGGWGYGYGGFGWGWPLYRRWWPGQPQQPQSGDTATTTTPVAPRADTAIADVPRDMPGVRPRKPEPPRTSPPLRELPRTPGGPVVVEPDTRDPRRYRPHAGGGEHPVEPQRPVTPRDPVGRLGRPEADHPSPPHRPVVPPRRAAPEPARAAPPARSAPPRPAPARPAPRPQASPRPRAAPRPAPRPAPKAAPPRRAPRTAPPRPAPPKPETGHGHGHGTGSDGHGQP